MSTLFTRIINGELGCFKVYEDEHTMAFLSKFAVQPGHVLIVPKVEVDSFLDVPEPFYSAVFKNAKLVGKAIQAVTRCKRMGGMIAGWDVPHFHYHLVPMMSHEDMDPKNARELGFEENKRLQEAIVAAIAQILQQE